jgi:hypothetical protein
VVDLSIAEGNLTLHVRGADKLWAFKSTLEIPLVHIAGVGQTRRSHTAGTTASGCPAPASASSPQERSIRTASGSLGCSSPGENHRDWIA